MLIQSISLKILQLLDKYLALEKLGVITIKNYMFDQWNYIQARFYCKLYINLINLRYI